MHSPLRSVLWLFRPFHRVTWEITRALKWCRPENKEGEARGMEGGNETNMDERIIKQKRDGRAGIQRKEAEI